MSELTKKEIDAILEKIRTEYRNLSKENSKLFIPLHFEQRYTQVLVAKTSVPNFLKTEIDFLEKLKEKHKEVIDKKNASKGETINRILDEQEAKLKKYPRLDFHPLGRVEMRYFYGALSSFAELDLPVLVSIYRGTPEYNMIADAIISIERIGISRRGMPSLRINEHIKAILDANGNQGRIEQDTQNILKEVSIQLKKLMDTLNESLNKSRVSVRLKVLLNEGVHPKAAREFNGKTFGESLEIILNHCNEIIQDFRMAEIVNLVK